jgi:formylglycine-generating enzyme required for sulfatase activity
MDSRTRRVLLAGFLVFVGVSAAHAYLRLDVTTPPKKTPPKKNLQKLAVGVVKKNPKDGLKYIWIPPGTFRMGCSPGDRDCGIDEIPAHAVALRKGFWIGQTEVTVGAYKRFVQQTGRKMFPAPSINTGWGNDAMPMMEITWDEAQVYCKWAGGRLPTEAEWEYAARGGNTAARYGPLDEVAWHVANSGHQLHVVGQKSANGFGLFDTLGNVWEWVNDWYDQKYYKTSPGQDPPGPTSGQYRVLRGASWNFDPKGVRVSVRGRLLPRNGGTNVGVRCAGEVFKP